MGLWAMGNGLKQLADKDIEKIIKDKLLILAEIGGV